MAHADVYDIRDFVVKDDQGRDIGMRDLLRPVTLIVNIDCKEGHDVNTECKDLQHLYARFRERGLEIVAFPSDQFQVLSSQGKYLTGADVKADLAKRYGVSFPVMDKVRVNGDEAHPLFLFLQKRLSGFPTNAIKWDFTKFLIVNGEPTKRYAPTTSPHSIEGEITHALDNIRGSGMSQQQQQFSSSNISDSSQVPASYTSSVQSQPLQDTSRLERSDDSTLGKGVDNIPSGLQVSEPEIREYDVRDAESNTQAHVVASRTEAVGTIPMSGQAQRSLGGQPFVHVKSVESTVIGQPRDTEEQSSKWSSQSVQGSQLGGNLSEGSGVSGEGVKSSDLGTRDWNAPASQQWETPEQSKELWKDDSKQNLQKPIQQQQQQPMQQQQQQPMQQSWRQDDSGKNVPEPGANLEYTHQGTHLRSGLHESRVSETSPFVQGTATGSHVMGVKPASHFHGSDPTYTDKQK